MPFNHTYLIVIDSWDLKKLQIDLAFLAIWSIASFFFNLELKIIKSKCSVTIVL